MFGLRSLRIGSIFGIPIEINPTWLVIFVLISATLSFGYYPDAFPGRAPAVDILSGILTAALFFVSIVFHELSHSLVARAGGLRISKVTLFMFGGVAQMEDEPSTPARELLMAAAGPAASLVLASALFVAYVILAGIGASNILWGPLEYLALINLSVAVFNMLPGFPLDGGRILRAILWWTTGNMLSATRWAARSGQLIGYAMIAAAVFGVIQGSLDLIWFGLVGWFISTLADSSLRQQQLRDRLTGVPVLTVMSAQPTIVSADLTVESLVHEHFLSGQHSRYPVEEEGRIVGLVSLSLVKRVPRSSWGEMRVGDVVDRDISALAIGPSMDLGAALDRLTGDGPGALLVVDQGRLMGILTRADIVSWIQRDQAMS